MQTFDSPFPPLISQSQPWDTGKWVQSLVVPLQPPQQSYPTNQNNMFDLNKLPPIFATGVPRSKQQIAPIYEPSSGKVPMNTHQVSYGGFRREWTPNFEILNFTPPIQ